MTISIYFYQSMHGSRNFSQVGGGGGGGVSDSTSCHRKSLPFLYMYFNENIIFKGVQHYPGGWWCDPCSTFSFQGGRGSNCSFPIETHITCDFPGRGGLDPCPPSSGSVHVVSFSTCFGCQKSLSYKRRFI